MTRKTLPNKYAQCMSSHGPVIEDSHGVFAWGFKPTGWLDEGVFSELGKFGEWHCIEMGRWVLVTKWQTISGLIKSHGQVRAIVVGPQGGYKFAIYGETQVYDRRWDPRERKHVPEWFMDEYERWFQSRYTKANDC